MRLAAADLQVRQLPDVERNRLGTPRIDSIFRIAREASKQPLQAYVNADILLMPDVLEAACAALKARDAFLLVGQRWDLDVREALEFGAAGVAALRRRTISTGSLHPPGGSDYFLFPRDCFTQIPPFAVGRAGWDNWMIYHARRQRWPVIDATASVLAVHQSHDYAHLPQGHAHYRLPETDENLRLAGGRRRIFRLSDADFELVGGKVQRRRLTVRRAFQEIERAPVLRTESEPLATAVFALFRPVRAFREAKGILRYRLRRNRIGSAEAD